MKKKVLSVLSILIGAGLMNTASAQAFSKGTSILNLGLGVGGHLGYWGAGYSSTPYFVASFDHGVYNFEGENKLSIGVGGFLGYKSVWYEWVGSWIDKNGNWHYNQPVKSTWTYLTLGVRPSLNYSFNDKAMVYGALHLGYFIVNHKYSEPTYASNINYGSYVGYGFLVGGRYFFSKSFGVYGELGWGISYLNLGVSFKF